MAINQALTSSLFADAEIISQYSRAQAIEDGFLVDISENEICQQHYKYPIALTRSVWDILQKAVSNKKFLNDWSGILHDLLFMSRNNAKKLSDSTLLFQVIIRGASRKSLYTFKVVCGPGDNGEPVLTIMMPIDD